MTVDNTDVPAPIGKFLTWYSEAQKGKKRKGPRGFLASAGFRMFRKTLSVTLPWLNLFRPDFAALATVTPDGKPAARMVLFKGIADGGFSFYTDYESDKGKELAVNPSAVLLFCWSIPPRQVRIDGRVKKLSRQAAERYWESRTRANQVAFIAVRQSSILSSREEFTQKVRQVEQAYHGRRIPCPDSWGGYSLVPEAIEFWEGRLDWLHEREKYVLTSEGWTKLILGP